MQVFTKLCQKLFKVCAHQLLTLLQDLCVKVDSTEAIVLLVLEIQREEELISQAIKQKKAKEVQQEVQRMQVWEPSSSAACPQFQCFHHLITPTTRAYHSQISIQRQMRHISHGTLMITMLPSL